MPYRKLPQTDESRWSALNRASRAYRIFVTNQSDPLKKIQAMTVETNNLLTTTLNTFGAEIQERGTALTLQSEATLAKDVALAALEKHVSHFIIVLNLAIDRGKYTVSVRPMYGLDISQENVPPLTRESDAYDWVLKIIRGETERIAGGGVPMQNPSLEDMQRALDTYSPLREDQLRKKMDYDKEQEDVEKMRRQVDELIKDMWDQVEFYFRKDEASSLRRKARAWGVEYASRPGETPEPESEVFTGTVEPAKSKEIMHNGYDVNTMLIIKNTGPVPIDLYTAASASDPLPGTLVRIEPGIETEVWASELGAESNTYLMVYNAHATIAGSYQVVLGNPE